MPLSLAVVVPARDEERLLGHCLASVRAAAAAVHAAVHVVVVADRCVDDTEGVARRALAPHDASIVRSRAGNVGAARRLGVAAARRTAPDAHRLWIAMTDADSIVPRDWLAHHLRAAAQGVDVLVGPIAVTDWSARARSLQPVLTTYRRTQRAAGRQSAHGANLGVRAAALDAVGGVPAIALGEDAALVAALERGRRVVRRSARPVVITSARRSARAPGGFSTLLDELERTAAM